jgi:hypothetical protein
MQERFLVTGFSGSHLCRQMAASMAVYFPQKQREEIEVDTGLLSTASAVAGRGNNPR